MKLLMILGLAGFAIGLGGATSIVVVREGEANDLAKVIADSTAAATDSLDPAHADSSATAAASHLPSNILNAADSAEVASIAADSVATDSAHMEPVEDPAVARERLAKLFGSMQPRDAARVMTEMGDTEVRILLALLGDRQASAILSSLPPARAAAITTMVIGSKRSNP